MNPKRPTYSARSLARALLAAPCALAALAGALACDDGGDNGSADASVDRRPITPPTDNWTATVVESDDFGMYPRLTFPAAGSAAAIAYYAFRSREDGPCTQVSEDPSPTRSLWDLHVAVESGEEFNVSTVDSILYMGAPPGLAAAVAPDGSLNIATVTGEVAEGLRYCSANDLGLYTSTNLTTWSTPTIVVAESDQAATGMADSDFGTYVGHWPALAFAADGAVAIAYKDVHDGSIQGDDFFATDLEFAGGTVGAFTHEPIDWGRSAGDHANIVFDANGNPVVVYYLPNESTLGMEGQQGIWAARSTDDGATWEKVLLSEGPTVDGDGPDVAVDAEGIVRVVYYDSSLGVPFVATLRDPSAFTTDTFAPDGWDFEAFGDSFYDEGYAASIAVSPSPDGTVAVAYYRCVEAAQGLGDCSPTDDAVVFAWLAAGSWRIEVVDNGGEGSCGMDPSLAFDAAGIPGIAYTCRAVESGTAVYEVHFARRKTAP